MASNNSTIDGMGFEEANQGNNLYGNTISGVRVEALLISGTNVYADTNVVADRVYGDEYFSGATVYASTAVHTIMFSGTYVYADATIHGEDIVANDTVSDSDGELKSSIVIESGAAVYGAQHQAGSGVLASNDAWIVFPKSYTGIPAVITQNRDDVDASLHLVNGSVGTGSFYVVGTNATDNFSWMAVGV